MIRASLGRLASLVRKERIQLLRDPRTRRIIFVSPVIQLIIFGYAVNTDVRNVATVLLDRDGSQASRELTAAFTAGGYFQVVEVARDESDIERALDGGRARVALVVPVGYGREVTTGAPATVQLLVDGTSSNTAAVAQGYANRIVQAHGVRLAAGTRGAQTILNARGSGGLRGPGGVELRTRAWFNPELESRVYNIPAVMGMILMVMSLLLTAMTVVREREMGTMDQLQVSPLTPLEFILGKTIPVVGVALVQLVLVAAVALLWFRIPFRGSLLVLLLGAFLFILAGLAIGLVISTISNTQQEAFLSIFLVLLPAVILSGLLYPVETMPPFFQWLTLANPMRHFLEIVRDLFLKGAGLRELYGQFAALALLAGTALTVAVWRFRVQAG